MCLNFSPGVENACAFFRGHLPELKVQHDRRLFLVKTEDVPKRADSSSGIFRLEHRMQEPDRVLKDSCYGIKRLKPRFGVFAIRGHARMLSDRPLAG